MHGLRAHIGSFTSAGGRGVVTAAVGPGTGALTALQATDAVADPSFLTVDPVRGLLYAVSETDPGAAAAFRLTDEGVEPAGPAVPVAGVHPTHLALAAGHLVTANYGSGSVSTLSLGADGLPTGDVAVLRHEGSGPDAGRQEGPHAHWVGADPTGRWLLSVDLGTDSVRVCRVTGDGAAVHGETPLRAGSGPRHLAFHPRGHRAYVVNELAPTVTVLAWDADRGELTPLDEVRALPEDAEGPAYASGIVAAADGRFLYTALRGHDSVSVLALDDTGSALTLEANVPCGGDWPRDLALHPQGTHLYVANERSGDVTCFALDEATGVPLRTGALPVPAASCVVFA
ncbi:6-phosphogluconolactonase [Streptomyces sp. RB5]|uniref:6-phosphogluconolactonase n=1 Tax=Streptomyces smaragdinus TaxID=2585196 RepID=A0A7K0CE47_9ACTN|nr:lactonase family protein [Streptomyces smaragdinus]MQY11748.1 6-phosphogluconolactonase [Streptomyces smaragdinus]